MAPLRLKASPAFDDDFCHLPDVPSSTWQNSSRSDVEKKKYHTEGTRRNSTTTTTNNNEAIFPGLGSPLDPGKVRVPPRLGGRPTRWHGSGAAAARLGGVGRRSSPTPRTVSHGGALADLTDFRGPGSKKSIFSKYLKTVGESKERHRGPNGSPWDPPSPGMHPGTPPHTQPEIWPIFRFWAHQGPCEPQGTGPFWGPGVHTRGWRVPGASVWSPMPFLRFPNISEIFWKNRFF